MSTQGGGSTPVPPPPAPYSSQASSDEVSAYELSLGVLRPSQVLAERYKILAQIGQGGMGKVYKAEDLNLKRTVVVKVAHNDSGDEEKEQARFRREALKMASLSHPNIVSIYDYGEQDGVQYLVMELVDGDMLKGELKERGPFEMGRFFEVIIQLLEGLSSAHQQQVIHRDIKPSNLMWDQRSSLLKILDFGLARGVEGDTLTGTGNVHGSIQYMAPEQIRGDSQDERTDIYAVGVLAYQLIAGELPFGGESTVELMFHKLQYRPTPLIERLSPESWVTPALSQLIEHCLEIEPAQRVRDASECLRRFKALRQQLTPDAERHALSSPTEVAAAFNIGEETSELDALSNGALLRALLGRREAVMSLSALLVVCVALSYLVGTFNGPVSQPPKPKARIELNTTPKLSRAADHPLSKTSEPAPTSAKSVEPAGAQIAAPDQVEKRAAPRATPTPSSQVKKRPVKRQPPPRRSKGKLKRGATVSEPVRPLGVKPRAKVGDQQTPAQPAPPSPKKVEENDVPLIDF